MNQQLTERQILQTWNNAYNLYIKSGFSIPEAVQHADAALAAKRAQLREDAPAPVKRSPHGYNLYWCTGAGRYVSVPED